MTTKTGEKLRGRKRDPSVLEKAWETRRAKKRLALRQSEAIVTAVKTGSSKPSGRTANASKRSKQKAARSRLSARPGPKKRTRKAVRTSPSATVRRSDASATTATGASEAAGANQAVHFENGTSGWVITAAPDLGITARVILTEARKKDGGGAEAAIVEVLRNVAHTAKMEEQRRVEEHVARQRREHLRVTDQAVVCGFLAEVEAAQKMYRGFPKDMVWNINSHTIVKIVDTLNKAGYHGGGFRDPVTRDSPT